ncbi:MULTISPECIES: Do family serine endopeptidase [Roseobacteraceae]|jgi:serine protease Do|uniref:Periplasmic pH-dependent serine endoprotease DegQ n=1 Tax=Pseudosulfitobacter pseudonitzschiae TaxID=1402135 RepID=A0A221K759_9RHOB|nr:MULTISPECIES: Do family serine endopeptidase [Roseobacteraceae]ASM74838.1 periplasmic pH-dependent serine endoprotease DegQ [Pseudosulfitobacter pseudonitzschiae]
MTYTPIFRRFASSAALVAALGATGATMTVASPALAVPAGGYGDLVETVAPAVVFIEVTAKAQPTNMSKQLPEGIPDELRRQFEKMMPQNGQQPARQGLGSGFIISEDGKIVTNNHVVEGAETVKVKLADGRSFDATVIGSDPMTDVAVLQLDTDEKMAFVNFGDSDAMRAGDEVVAVGNPFGLGGTVTTGIVSALSRNINSGPYDNYIQTDAAINRGNSGGPLFNNEGKVIGMNTAIFSPDGGSVGIGFAVPSDLVQSIVADLSDDGMITRGWLGVQIKPMPAEIAQVLGFDQPKGAMIQAVSKDSPAAKAGLTQGDIILSFNETEIVDTRDLTRAVASTNPDTVVPVKILHQGAEKTVEIAVGKMPTQDT